MTGANPRTLLARLAVIALLCVGAASGAAYWLWPSASPPAPVSASLDPPEVPPLPAAIAPVMPVPVTPAPPPRPGVAPSFDVVRVGPHGAVLAGRAEPGATVVVANNDATLGWVQANARGEWVLVSASALAPGGRELSLSARSADGRDVPGEGTVLLDMPASPAAAPVTALLVPQAGAPRVLPSAPDDTAQASGAKPEQRPAAHLALDAVDYDDRRATRFAGQAPPGAAVRAYVDDAPAGDAAADAQGRWAMAPHRALRRGAHRLRIDQLDEGGQVVARIELPFQRAAPPARLAAGRVVVQPGQTLWRIARRAYGKGVRYTVIYLANRDQIRDPRLIYPGQAFAMPVVAR